MGSIRCLDRCLGAKGCVEAPKTTVCWAPGPTCVPRQAHDEWRPKGGPGAEIWAKTHVRLSGMCCCQSVGCQKPSCGAQTGQVSLRNKHKMCPSAKSGQENKSIRNLCPPHVPESEPQLAPRLSNDCPTIAKPGAEIPAEVGNCVPEIGRSWTNVGQLRQKLADVGHCRPILEEGTTGPSPFGKNDL